MSKIGRGERFPSEHMHDREKRLRELIDKHWQCILPYIPHQAVRFHRTKWIDGFCTDTEHADEMWINSRGGHLFAMYVPPEDFFWLGIQNRTGSEYLFVMWYRGKRRFWFYDQYVLFYDGSKCSFEKTEKKLIHALERWEASHGDVIFSGPWGWYDAANHQFEKDSTEAGQMFLKMRREEV